MRLLDRELPDALRKQWDSLDFSEQAFLGAVGLSVPAGEKGRSVLEMTWSRPTCEVNGMGGGYQGAGFKTVIPAEARAKISFRLVHKQDPERIRDAFRAFIRARIPADCTVEFHPHGGSPAIQLPYDSPELTKARDALSREWGKPALLLGGGGSIPVVGDFQTYLGITSLMVGFALDDDRIHSPNEKYNLDSFHKGQRSWARILDSLAK